MRLLSKQQNMCHAQEVAPCAVDKGAVLRFEETSPVVGLVAQNCTHAAMPCGLG